MSLRNSTGCSAVSTRSTQLAMFDRPVRFMFLNGGIYVLVPALMLLLAHYLIVMKFDWPPLYLRIASFIIPLPFGIAAFASAGSAFAAHSGWPADRGCQRLRHVLGGILYRRNSIVPESFREWRETTDMA